MVDKNEKTSMTNESINFRRKNLKTSGPEWDSRKKKKTEQKQNF